MCSAADDPSTYGTEARTVTTFDDELREKWGEDYESTLADIAAHGADAGYPGITHYRDTVALYGSHEDEVWEALAEDADDMGLPHPLALVATFGGAANVHSPDQLDNLLCWYMVERIASRAED